MKYRQIKGYPHSWNCCICGKHQNFPPDTDPMVFFDHAYGHNPEPFFARDTGARCCSECNRKFVSPMRSIRMSFGKDIREVITVAEFKELEQMGKTRNDCKVIAKQLAKLYEKNIANILLDKYNEYEMKEYED